MATLHDGFLRGDLTGVVLLLAAATAKPHLRQAGQEAFEDACTVGEAAAAALLLEGDGVDGNAALNPGHDGDDDPSFQENEPGDTVSPGPGWCACRRRLFLVRAATSLTRLCCLPHPTLPARPRSPLARRTVAAGPAFTPQFPPTWDLRQSTWVMACNYTGFLRRVRAAPCGPHATVTHATTAVCRPC